MAVNVTDYMTKFQEEGLNAIKRTQAASLEALQSFQSFTKELNDKPGTVPAFENIPSPTQFVEMSFGFASQLLELRKAFTMHIAEMMVDTQKNAEANMKAATSAAQTATSPAPNKPVAK